MNVYVIKYMKCLLNVFDMLKCWNKKKFNNLYLIIDVSNFGNNLYINYYFVICWVSFGFNS